MLDKYISALGSSRPIFTLNVSHDKDDVHSRLVEEYVPVPDPNDPISVLVCAAFAEKLSDNKFVPDSYYIKDSVYRTIKREMRMFITKHGGFKNANQSAIFRFMSAMRDTPGPATDGLVYLYRYSKSLGMAINGDFPVGVDQKHIDNMLAIIELMRSKFETK